MRNSKKCARGVARPSTCALVAVAGSLAATASRAVWAQEPVGASSSTSEVQEILITAERRAEGMSKVPIAATALGAEQIAERGILELEDLQYQAPSLTINTTGSATFINIRGVGLNSGGASVTSGVAIHVDGAFIIGTGLSMGDPFYDLERIEVLRGPQGTFVGQQSTGGAMFLVTRNPRFEELEFNVAQSIGNYDWRKTEGAVNLPISERVAARIAFNLEDRDSYFTNLGTIDSSFGASDDPRIVGQRHPGDLNEQNVRVKLLAEPRDDLSILLTHDTYRMRTDGWAQQPPNYTGDPFTLAYDFPTHNNRDVDRTIAEINWDLSQGIRLRSLTSYQTFNVVFAQDLDATAVADRAQNYQIGPNRVITQELNLLSSGEGPLEWAIGGFYAHQKTRSTILTSFYSQGRATAVDSPGGYTESLGFFGQMTYAFSPKFNVTAGLRYNTDEQETPRQTTVNSRPPAAPTTSVRRGRASSSMVTGKLAFEWQVTDDNMLYLTASKGSKAGGFNLPSSNFPGSNFEPEVVYNYEIGWKGALLDRRLRLALDAYIMDYEDFQLAIYDPAIAASYISNLEKSAVKGFEAQVDARFGPFSFNVSAAYADAQVRNAPLLIDSRLLPGGGTVLLPPDFDYSPYLSDVEGRVLPYAPEWTINAGIQYDVPVGSGMFTTRLQWAYISELWNTLFQQPVDLIDSHETLDLRLTYRPNDHWSLEGFVTNLTDEVYIAGFRGENKFYGAPREYGLKVSYRY